MNCKQGDLAIVVRSTVGNEGKIVSCVKLFGYLPSCPHNGVHWANGIDTDYLEIDPPVIGRHNATGELSPCSFFPDAHLRPLRGDLLDEETETGRELVHAR
jgi:hypothetical protein